MRLGKKLGPITSAMKDFPLPVSDLGQRCLNGFKSLRGIAGRSQHPYGFTHELGFRIAEQAFHSRVAVSDSTQRIDEKDGVAAGLSESTHKGQAFVLLAHPLLHLRVQNDDRRLPGERFDEAELALPKAVCTQSAYPEHTRELAISDQGNGQDRLGRPPVPASCAWILANVGNQGRSEVSRDPAGHPGLLGNRGPDPAAHDFFASRGERLRHRMKSASFIGQDQTDKVGAEYRAEPLDGCVQRRLEIASDQRRLSQVKQRFFSPGRLERRSLTSGAARFGEPASFGNEIFKHSTAGDKRLVVETEQDEADHFIPGFNAAAHQV